MSWLTLNVSCPNTKEGMIETAQELDTLLAEIQKLNSKHIPLLLKLSPDTHDELLVQVMDLAGRFEVCGFICGNTTLSRPGSTSYHPLAGERGGLSGRPIKELSLRLVRKVYGLKAIDQVIVGVGGIFTGGDAYDFIKAGANVVQLYTGLIWQGPTCVRDICADLSNRLQSDGLSLAQATGGELS